jgi:hypothetical protein
MTTFRDIIKHRLYRCGYILLLVLPLVFSGCASLYFRDAGELPPLPPRFDLSHWPYNEYWTGIVFNGAKIGFSHFSLSPAKEAVNRFDIRSEAFLRVRFLTFDKKINLKSYDQVAEDLTLKRFVYDFDMDGNRMKLFGRIADGMLVVEIKTAEQTAQETIPLKGPLYPASVIGLYPVLHGLEVGRTYRYTVYDGETQSVDHVEQDILAFEESDLFFGQAYKIKTRFHGQTATTWIDPKGRPLLEMSLGGVIISALESKSVARKYLAQAALNKEETLLDFSLIKSNIPISDPGEITAMEIILTGIDKKPGIPSDERQACEFTNGQVLCRINSRMSDDGAISTEGLSGATERYLLPSYIIPSRNPLIRQTAGQIVMNEKSVRQQVRFLVDWLQENIQQKPVDVFTALDVLEGGQAECQGFTFLYSAFARSLGIPTRVVSGIVYSVEYQGFLYHTWAESLVNGHWLAVDPTFRQIPADATHIKFIEGEKISDLLPIVDLIGHIQLRIVSTDRH